jgi:hypothetical protein
MNFLKSPHKFFPKFEEYSAATSINEAKELLSELDAYNIFVKNCTWYTPATVKIYRGMKIDSEFALIDSKDFTQEKYYQRKSYTTILISELNSWKDYPPRLKSIVCTTNLDTASTYGSTYRVLPYDGAEFCITPKQSLEYCFKRPILSKLKFSIFSELNMLLEKLFTITGVAELDAKLTPKSFYTQLNKLQDKKFQQDILSKDTTSDSIMKFFEEINNYNGSVKEYFSEILDPRDNGFFLSKINSQLEIRGPKELWFTGKALLIKETAFNRFMQTAQSKLKDTEKIEVKNGTLKSVNPLATTDLVDISPAGKPPFSNKFNKKKE